MEAVKSTFTRWIGFLMAPELVKKRETSLPLSAMRAMLSAETGVFLRGVFFIKFCMHVAVSIFHVKYIPFFCLAWQRQRRIRERIKTEFPTPPGELNAEATDQMFHAR